MSQNDWKWSSYDDLKMIRFFDQYLVTRNDETEKTIADPTTDPGWYVLPTDPPTLLFKGTEKLKIGMIAYPIIITEYGYAIENTNDKAWTATTISGVLFDNMDNCNEWQSSAVNHFAIYGSPFETNFKWTALNETSCDQKLHLYCIENN